MGQLDRKDVHRHDCGLTVGNWVSQPPSSSQHVRKKTNSTHQEINNYPQTSRSSRRPFTTLLSLPTATHASPSSSWNHGPSSHNTLITVSRHHSQALRPTPSPVRLYLMNPEGRDRTPRLDKHSLFTNTGKLSDCSILFRNCRREKT